MNNLFIPIVLLLTMSCNEGDPCSDFISEADVSISQNLACSHDKEYGNNLLVDINISSEELRQLDLKYVWNIGGQTYEDERILISETETGIGTLVISNPGCSIDIDFTLGDYDFEQANPTAIGNKVWLDDRFDGTMNIFDSSDSGFEGILVELLLAIDSSVVAQEMTDHQGTYVFIDFPPDDYLLRFHNPDIHSYEFCRSNAGIDDILDSDVIHRDGYTHIITVGDCEVNLTIDAGMRIR